MAYTASDLILAAHYNTFVAGDGTFGIFNHNVANINTIWGLGFGDQGYGQVNTLAQINIGAVVSATQWATLISRLTSAGTHQATVLGAMPPALTGGDLIEAITTMQSNVDDVYANALNAIAIAATDTDDARHNVLFKDGPVTKDVVTWEDVLFADGSDENKMDVMEKIKGKMKIEDQAFQKTDFTGLPYWFKNTAKYWTDDKITDDEFIRSVKYLKDAGIIREYSLDE